MFANLCAPYGDIFGFTKTITEKLQQLQEVKPRDFLF